MENIDPVLIWFLVGLALALLELVMPGVILIFFAAGAWIAAATTYFGWTDSVVLQIVVFAVSSTGLLLGLRQWVQGRLSSDNGEGPTAGENLDDFQGKQVKVLKEILPGRSEAAVEFKGAVWTVIAHDYFRQGETATVTGVEGIALKITKPTEE